MTIKTETEPRPGQLLSAVQHEGQDNETILSVDEQIFLATLRSLSPEGQKKLRRAMEEIHTATSTSPYGRLYRKEHK